MTENEAIKHLQSYAEVVDDMIKYCKDFEPKADITGYLEKKTVFAMAISAIKEVQQYREIGTVEECREAVEKQKPKKHGTGGHANGMGDLISRKSLIEKLDEWCGSQTYLISEEVWKIIKNFPKAFDKEKVIDELKRMEEESCKEWNEYGDAASLGKVITFAEAIEIVERGGI